MDDTVPARIIVLETRVDELRRYLRETSDSQLKAAETKWSRTLTLSGILSTVLIAICIAVYNLSIVPLKEANVELVTSFKVMATELKAKLDRAEVSDIRSDMKSSIKELNSRIDDLNAQRRRKP